MDVTYNFTAGTRAVAQQVNTNFADVKSAVDPLETAVADIESQLTSGIILPDGSIDFARLQSYKTYTVSNATNATPIVVTAIAHDFITGDKVFISGVGGNTAANGEFTITKIGPDTFSLDGSVGNGAFSGNGTALIVPVNVGNLISKSYLDNNAGGVNKFDNKGTVTTNITLAENKITTGYWSGTNTITLPTVTDTAKQVVCELWFTTANTGQPTITNTNLKWDASDRGLPPTAYSTLSGVVNVLKFKSYFEGSTLKWASEYTTFGSIEVAFAQPVLSANGTLGGASFAISVSSFLQAGREGYRAFDNNASTFWTSTTGGQLADIIMYNPNGLKTSTLTFTNRSDAGAGAPSNYSLYGSNDNSTYTLINTYSNSNQTAGATWNTNINSTEFYKYHKIHINSIFSGTETNIAEILLTATYLQV